MALTKVGNRWVAVDVETTGLSFRRGGRIIEIGALAIEEGEIVSEFETLLHCDAVIPWQVSQIHGITQTMLQGKPTFREILPSFCRFIRDSVLIAHNAPFEVGFLRAEFGRLGLPLKLRSICTLRLSQRYFPELPNHRLETVYNYIMGQKNRANQCHRALADARMVAAIWLYFLREANGKSASMV